MFLESRSPKTEEVLSKDTIFSMLSNQRRRFVIHYLKRHEGPVRIRDLAQQVAAWENGIEVEELTYKQRKRVYTSLHQTHLPKLNDVGIVDYDRDRGTIELAEHAAVLDIYLDVVSEHDIPWSDYYLGLSAVATALLVAAWVNVFPFTVVPDLAYGLLITLLFVGSSVVHAYYTRQTRVGGTETPAEVLRTMRRQTNATEANRLAPGDDED